MAASEYLWLSAAGHLPPVYVSRTVLTQSAPASWFARAFGGTMALPARLPAALEAQYAGGAPIYVVEAPPVVLAGMLDYLRVPAMGTPAVSGVVHPRTWRAYCAYFGLPAPKRGRTEDDADDDNDKAALHEEPLAKRRRPLLPIPQADDHFVARCRQLMAVIQRGHPKWAAFARGEVPRLTCTFHAFAGNGHTGPLPEDSFLGDLVDYPDQLVTHAMLAPDLPVLPIVNYFTRQFGGDTLELLERHLGTVHPQGLRLRVSASMPWHSAAVGSRSAPLHHVVSHWPVVANDDTPTVTLNHRSSLLLNLTLTRQ